jgi:hypothetical protein
MVHGQNGVRECVAHGRREGGGRVDRHVGDTVAKSVGALAQRRDHGGCGAALALPEQPLIASQVDEPSVLRVDPRPLPRLGGPPEFGRPEGVLLHRHVH